MIAPEQEAALVENMAEAIDPNIPWTPHPTWKPSKHFVDIWKNNARSKARAALRLAEPVIRDAALEEAAKYFENGTGWGENTAISIRSLKSINRPAPQETK